MKTRTSLILCVLAVLGLVAVQPVHAATLYWSGTDTWDDGTALNWGTGTGGPYNTSAWVGASDANFEGTADTVNVSGTIASVNSITFATDGHTLSGGGTITMTGAGGNITTGAGTDTISSVIAGSVGLTKQGAGTLILSSAQSYAGPTIINNGTLQLQGTPTGFQYYRFTPTAYRGGGGEQLSELQFFLNDTWTAATTVTAPGNNSPGNEQPPNANDNDTGTKWYTGNRVALIYDFGSVKTFDEYNWATANDSTGRDPIRWSVEGSNDNSTWTIVDDKTGADQSVTTVRYAWVAPGASRYLGWTLTLPPGGSNFLPTTTAVSIAANSTLDLGGINQQIASLADAVPGSTTGHQVLLGSGKLTVGDSTSATFSGAISGTGGQLIKVGDGTLILNGANTYTGATTINAGALTLSGSGSNYSGPMTVNAGTLTATNGTIATLNVPGGTANLYSPATAAAANVSGGIANLNGNVTNTLTVTSGTANLNTPATATAANVSGGQLNLNSSVTNTLKVTGGTVTTTGSSATVGTADFSAGTGTVNASAYPLAVTNVAKFSNGVSITQGGGGTAFTLTGSDVLHPTAGSHRVLTASSGLVTVVANAFPTSGLVGRWTFNDDTADDSSGNGYNGTIVGAPTFTTNTHDGQGKALNVGGAGYVKVDTGGSQTVFDGGTAMTISAWVNGWPAHQQDQSFVSKNGNTNGWRIGRVNNWGTQGFVTNGSNLYQNSEFGGGWLLYTMTYDGTTKTIYYNGVFDGSVAWTGPINPTNAWLVFGGYDDGNHNVGNSYLGMLDDIAFYNRALTATEAAQLFTPMPGSDLDWSTTDLAATSTSEVSLPAGVTSLGNLSLSGASTKLTLSGATATGASFDNISATNNSSIAVGLPISLRTGNVAVSGGKTLTVSTNIVNGTLPTALNKLDSGTLVLTGANTYTGDTKVSAGTLKLTTAGNNNIANSAKIIVGDGAILDVRTVTGPGGFQVVSGQTLGGSGAITGAVTINSGGHYAPGASVGQQSVGSLTLSSGSFLDFEFNSTPANDKTIVTTNNGLTIHGGGFYLYNEGGATAFSTNGAYQLINYSGAIGGTGIGALSVLNKDPDKQYTFSAVSNWLELIIGEPVFDFTSATPITFNVLKNAALPSQTVIVTNNGVGAGVATFAIDPAFTITPETTGIVAKDSTGSSALSLDSTSDYRTITGKTLSVTPAGTSASSIAIAANVGYATANRSNSPGAFGSPLTAAVGWGGSYATLESTVTGTVGGGGAAKVGSTATILAGINEGSYTPINPAIVSMAWRTRTTTETALVSDVVNLTGMDDGSGQTDYFVLQMIYNPDLLVGDENALASAGQIYLAWLDPGTSLWTNAGDTATYAVVVGVWSDSGTIGDLSDDLGRWGVNPVNDTAWAVVNHNSQFAVHVVPEPATLALLGLGGLGLLRRKRK